MHIGYWWDSQKETDTLEGQKRRWEINIKMDLRSDGVVWTGSIWLRVGISGGFL
jgi:hypothetical protein